MISITKVISREQFIELTKKNNLLAGIHILIRMSLLVACLSLADYFWNAQRAAFFVIFAYMYGVMISFIGFAGLAHELSHGSVFSSKILNKRLYFIACALVVENHEFFSRSHPYHHKNTFSKNDHEAVGSREWSISDILKYIFIDYTSLARKYFYTGVNALGFHGKNFSVIQQKYKRAALQIVVINLLFHATLWMVYNNYIINLVFTIGPFIGNIFPRYLARAQHLGLAKYAEKGPLYHSRTLLLPKPLAFLYANMNYHIEHHLAPSVPYYNLPKLHSQLLEKGFITGEHNYDYATRVFLPYIFKGKGSNGA